ncbi:MAG: hypothetical protein JO142_02220 [Burkholderiales bacterium]|nr:hypothetical protein [Burkholderiales bacterium]
MNPTLLQQKIYQGYGKAALRIGPLCNQYRPASALSTAIAPVNLINALPASFNAEDMAYSRARNYAKATWYALVDGTQVQPGDYLVRPDGRPFFIAAMQPTLPILAVECNRIVNIYRPQQLTGVGAVGYGGETAENDVTLVYQFPASLLMGTKGEKNLVNLPGDVRSPWWLVLLPNLPGNVYIRNDDVMTDDNGRRYVISLAEQTELGWRISATEAET